MTPEQYNSIRAFQQEQTLRELMALLMAAFPHLGRDIDTIGRNWDSRLDALDSQRAWENAAKAVSDEPVGAERKAP